MGEQATGVDIVVSVESQVAVVRVTGAVASAGEVHDLADRLLSSVPPAGPVIVDLSLVDVAPDELAWLVLRFEAAPHWHRFRLVDTRLGSVEYCAQSVGGHQSCPTWTLL